MNRRDLLLSSAAVAGVLVTQNVWAQEGGERSEIFSFDHTHAALLRSLGKCLTIAEACRAHCNQLLAGGDTSVAGCAKTVDEMIAGCRMLSTLAANKSNHLVAAGKLAAQLCADCEKQCRIHENHHAICKACAEACKECGAACAKLA